MTLKTLIKLVILVAVILTCIWIYHIRIGGNIHTVIEGELYRSAQPTPEQIKKYHEKYGIKTIINLRGRREKADWYHEETKMSTKLGIDHYDWAVSSTMMTPLSHMDHILWLMKKAEKPILIHCYAGADRTSLGVALYLYGIKTYSPENAKNEAMSVFFGHFPFLWSETDAIGLSFDKFTKAERSRRGLK